MAGRKKDGIDDLATLSELNEEIIIRELQARYNQDVIYVRIFPLKYLMGCFCRSFFESADQSYFGKVNALNFKLNLLPLFITV